MKAIYGGDFDCAEDVFNGFGIELVYAFYEVDGYDGWAHVLFVENGKLYEVHGSHCSCYGLEDLWRPEVVKVADVLADIKMGRTYNGGDVELLKRKLAYLKGRGVA